MSFTGIPLAATDFYGALQLDNSRGFWTAHKEQYDRDVRDPILALMSELEDEFGESKVFRPNRDLRFSTDKSPYKDHQGAYVAVAEATGWYLEVSADGFRYGGGCYHLAGDRLAAFRAAIGSDPGAELERILDGLTSAGWEQSGDTLKTAPRGWPRDHPRIGLLRHKSLTVSRWVDDGDLVASPALADEVRRGWRQLSPLVEWLQVACEDACE